MVHGIHKHDSIKMNDRTSMSSSFQNLIRQYQVIIVFLGPKAINEEDYCVVIPSLLSARLTSHHYNSSVTL